jgi:formylglycine-generating enzyme required for sulfatase activity
MKKYLLWMFGMMLVCGMLSGAAHAAVNQRDGAEMVWVPAGPFTMGAGRDAHTVTLDGYFIYKNEVTVAEYKQFCAATGRKMPNPPFWGWIDTHPIVNVTWFDAVAYCRWAGVRLPTEAQWEKAARGTDGRKYPWGNVWDDYDIKANTDEYQKSSQVHGTTPVGSFPKGGSPYGCLDMAGNVWEWCQDWYQDGYYKSSPTSNPTGPDNGQYRVSRGGSWVYDSYSAYSATRGNGDPSYILNNYGFRCVASGQ